MAYKETDFTIDRQRQQTMAVVHFVMETVNKYISPDDREHAHHELFEALDKAGVDIITAEHRAAAGLPPRSPKGWTRDELHIMEAKRIEALLAPRPPLIVTVPRS
jgi:predicted methyltransferase